jgi:hypothetical protein
MITQLRVPTVSTLRSVAVFRSPLFALVRICVHLLWSGIQTCSSSQRKASASIR